MLCFGIESISILALAQQFLALTDCLIIHAGGDIFALDKIFFPVNQNNQHWVCVVVYMQEKRIEYHDSTGGTGHQYLHQVWRYLRAEYKDKKRQPMPDACREWELVPGRGDGPRQLNCYDCGVFTCMFCNFLSSGRPLTFDQQHANGYRNYMALRLLKQRLPC